MKSKLKGVLGIGFALILVASLMLFAIPAAAGPYEDLDPRCLTRGRVSTRSRACWASGSLTPPLPR